MAIICLGSVHQIPPGSGKEFTVGDRVIAVFRTAEGKLFATQAWCPHANGHLADGALGARRIICPQHQWKFDLETGQCVGSEPARLKTYSVEEREGQIWCDLEVSGAR